MKKKIIHFLKNAGIEKCGVASYGKKSAIVCLFPYFVGFEEGNLSLYARSKDYHLVIKEKLTPVCDFIRTLSPDAECEIFADIGPEVDRVLAYRAGLGFYGKNNMLINDDYGSYFFIGYILCSLDLQPDTPIDKSCADCGLCIKSCVGDALGKGFDITKCASHISQKKGDLSPEEIAILKKSGLVFGCDTCQRVCPHNNITPQPMPEFAEDLIHSLCAEDIESLSNKEFLRKYKDRAFSWRGKNVLLRNLNLIN